MASTAPRLQSQLTAASRKQIEQRRRENQQSSSKNRDDDFSLGKKAGGNLTAGAGDKDLLFGSAAGSGASASGRVGKAKSRGGGQGGKGIGRYSPYANNGGSGGRGNARSRLGPKTGLVDANDLRNNISSDKSALFSSDNNSKKGGRGKGRNVQNVRMPKGGDHKQDRNDVPAGDLRAALQRNRGGQATQNLRIPSGRDHGVGGGKGDGRWAAGSAPRFMKGSGGNQRGGWEHDSRGVEWGKEHVAPDLRYSGFTKALDRNEPVKRGVNVKVYTRGDSEAPGKWGHDLFDKREQFFRAGNTHGGSAAASRWNR